MTVTIFPCARWNNMLLINFPRVKPRLFHLYVFTYKIVLFSYCYCRCFTNSFPFASSRISTMFYSRGLTTLVYSPLRNSLRFCERGLARSTMESTPKSPSPPRRKSVQSAPALVGTPKFMMVGWLSRRYYYYYYSNSTVTVPELRYLN